MLEFTPETPPKSEPIFNPQEIPKEMEIYMKSETSFLPPGKKLEDLTPEELTLLQNQYKFSPFRPGIYQGITAKGNVL